MADNKKKDILKSVLLNVGVSLVLIGSTAVKGDNLMFFLIGLILLAVQTLELKAEPGKLVLAEVMLAATVTIGSIVQLAMAKSFGTAQVFLVLMLLGGILVAVEALRKYADL